MNKVFIGGIGNSKELYKTKLIGALMRLSQQYSDLYIVGKNQKLQKVLGPELYFKKGNNWYHSKETENLTILQLEKIIDKLKQAINKRK